MKEPAGTTTISGHSGQSRNRSPAFQSVVACSASSDSAAASVGSNAVARTRKKSLLGQSGKGRPWPTSSLEQDSGAQRGGGGGAHGELGGRRGRSCGRRRSPVPLKRVSRPFAAILESISRSIGTNAAPTARRRLAWPGCAAPTTARPHLLRNPRVSGPFMIVIVHNEPTDRALRSYAKGMDDRDAKSCRPLAGRSP